MLRTSKKNNHLIIICNQFPFGYGETFLNNEFPYLHARFNKLTVISRSMSSSQTRSLPDNVNLFRFPPKSSLADKLLIFREAIKNRTFLIKALREENESIKSILGHKASLSHIQVMLHDLLKAFEIAKYIKKHLTIEANEDVIVYSYWQNAAAIAATMLKNEGWCNKAISRAHGGDLYFEAQKNNYLSFRKYISKNIDQLFFISNDGLNYQARLLKHHYPSFSLARLGTSRLEKATHLDSVDGFQIVSCSNIIPLKRIHLIVNALAEITTLKINWIHFGGGIDESKIQELAQEKLTPMSNITYEFKGKTDNSKIHKFYANNKIDLFINVSSSEGLPVSIMEAMSYGIPVIATDVGGTSEIVSSETGKLLSKNCSSIDVSTAIYEELKLDKSESIYAMWEKKYNAESNFTAFVQHL